MPRYLHRLALALLLALLPVTALADIVIGSWNLRNIGWDNGKRFDQVAQIAQTMDIIAIQEVMEPAAVERLERHLERRTGEAWEAMTSHLIGRGSYREAYAFLYRDASVEYVDGAVVFLDRRDTFSREPYSARFRSRHSGTEFVLANIHVLYGDSVSDRLPEVHALADYWDWLEEVYGDTPRVLACDCNLASEHRDWRPLRDRGVDSVANDGATTLSSHHGVYANEYDHLWLVPGRLPVSYAGKLRFPELLGISHEQARATVSDHAPVWITLGDAQRPLDAFQGAVSNAQAPVAANDPVYDCVDLNRSPRAVLERLPHIGEARSRHVMDGRPWDAPESLQRIRGLGPSRVGDIIDSGLLCRS